MGAQPRRQVVAFRFSSVLDTRQLQNTVEDAREALATQQDGVEQQDRTHLLWMDEAGAALQAPAPAAATLDEPALNNAQERALLLRADTDDAQLQRVLEECLSLHSFMDLVDRLERVLDRLVLQQPPGPPATDADDDHQGGQRDAEMRLTHH